MSRTTHTIHDDNVDILARAIANFTLVFAINCFGGVMTELVLARITELLKLRQWYRTNRWADWPDLRKENEVELRALLKLARQARKMEAAKPDPLDQYKSLHDFTESEARLAMGDR